MLRLLRALTICFALLPIAQGNAQPSSPGIPSSMIGAANGVAPLNANRLVPTANINGTINLENYPGITLGAGQSAAVQAANGVALNQAFATASASNLEVDCPNATTIEFNSSTGILVTQVAWQGIKARLNYSCKFVQFATNAPVIEIGNVAAGTYSLDIDWSGGDFEYGVPQTGYQNSICVLLGGMTNSIISNVTACGNLSSTGPVNPPYIGLGIGTIGYNGAAAFFTNTLSRWAIGGAQYELISINIGGTGVLFEDILAHNGPDKAGAQPLGFAALYINGNAQRTDDVFLRLNLEHFSSLFGIGLEGSYDTSFIGLHMEDVTLTGYSPAVWLLAGSQVKVIGSQLEDLYNASTGGTPSIFAVSYDSHLDVDGFDLRWLYQNEFPKVQYPGYLFAGVGSNPANDPSTFSINNLRVQEFATGLTNSANMQVDPINTTTLSTILSIGQYYSDALLPKMSNAVYSETGSATLYGNNDRSTVFYPATLATTSTLTLADKRAASGTGSSMPPAPGSYVHVHRSSGTYANALTVQDGGGTTLATITTAGVDLAFVFTGTAWVSAP